MEFYDGSIRIGAAPLSGGGAVLSISSLSVGTHSLTATYGGDAAHVPSVSPGLSQTVQPPPMRPNLVVNSGFESATSAWSGFVKPYVIIDGSTRYAGANSARFLASPTGRRTIRQDIRVYYGVWYNLAAVARTSGATTVVQVQWLDSSGAVLGTKTLTPLTGNRSWTALSGSFGAPKGVRTARILLGTEAEPDGAGTAWFDEVVFQAY
jgi:hypothetical protein